MVIVLMTVNDRKVICIVYVFFRTSNLGINASCNYKGLFFIQSGAGTRGSGHTNYITQELQQDNSIWRICAWHKNQREMQIGGKSSDVGWGPYEECIGG